MKLAGAMLALASTAWAADIIDCRGVPGWAQDGARREFVADKQSVSMRI
jgi:hypothetical protein